MYGAAFLLLLSGKGTGGNTYSVNVALRENTDLENTPSTFTSVSLALQEVTTLGLNVIFPSSYYLTQNLVSVITQTANASVTYGRTANFQEVTNLLGNVILSSGTVVIVEYPASGTLGVPVNTPLYVQFSQGINSGIAYFNLADASGNNFPGSFSYNPTGFELDFIRANYPALLNFSTDYTATVSGVKDLTNTLVPGVSWPFQTATASAGGGSSGKKFRLKVNPEQLINYREIDIIIE